MTHKFSDKELTKMLREQKSNIDYTGNINRNDNLNNHIASIDNNNSSARDKIVICGCSSCNIFFRDINKTNTRNYANRHCYQCLCYWCMCDYSRMRYGYDDSLITLTKEGCECPTCSYEDSSTTYQYSMDIRKFEIDLYSKHRTIISSLLETSISIPGLLKIVLSYFDIIDLDPTYVIEKWREEIN
jgi:hypothetical protein